MNDHLSSVVQMYEFSNIHFQPTIYYIYIHTAVSEHFRSNNHSDTHMLLIPIEKLNNERDSLRKPREAYIIEKAKNLEPLGINKRGGLESVAIYSIESFVCLRCYTIPRQIISTPAYINSVNS